MFMLQLCWRQPYGRNRTRTGSAVAVSTATLAIHHDAERNGANYDSKRRLAGACRAGDRYTPLLI